MKKIILSLAALAALSTASFAERTYDLRDSATARGTIELPADKINDNSLGTKALSAAPALPYKVKKSDLPNDIYDAHGFKR